MFAWRAFPSRGELLSGSAGARGPADPGAFLTVPALRSAGIGVAFTTRHGGHSGAPFESMNLSFVSGDDPDVVRANRERALAGLGARLEQWCSARQVHGPNAVRVSEADRGRGADDAESTIPETDALWTDTPGVALAVLTADCVPIALADPVNRRVAVVHAGWRGLVKGVIGAAASDMGKQEGLSAYVGPAIGPCCYEVGPEVADEARASLGDDVVLSNGNAKPHLDLWRAARTSLRRAGITSVYAASLCTRCEPHRFYSHRAGDAARQGVIAVIA